MRKLLETYHLYKPVKVCFLNSSYVDQILSEYPGYSKTFIRCNVKNEDIVIETNGLKVPLDCEYDLIVRLRVKVYDNDSKTYDIHVNLLIFNMRNHTIKHFEPLEMYELGTAISDTLRQRFSQTLPSFKFETLSFHPQREMTDECKNMGLCVAHVIRFAICHLHCKSEMDNVQDYDSEDIYKFCNAIIAIYG
jgi:hypothetical protein